MDKLRQQLEELLNRLEHPDELRVRLKELISLYPFNEFEYLISHLLANHNLTLEEYYEIRSEYIGRNLHSHLFEITPRKFGEGWAEGYVKERVPKLERPTIELDPHYSPGLYDFILPPQIRVEVKASRVVEYRNDKALHLKALRSDSTKTFDMNFQQLKPRYCDVFIWIAVWIDVIKCWVIPSSVIEKIYKPQHRGNIGEGQFHLKPSNIHSFDQYLTQLSEIEEAILKAYDKELELRQKSGNE